MATNEGEARLSPRRKAKFNLVLQAVQTGEVQVKKDSRGSCQADYTDKRTIPVDESKAHKIQVGKNAHDTTHLVECCLEMIEAIKQKQVPIGANRGVVIDKTKAGIGDQGQYEEGQQFTRTKEVLGKGIFAGDIVVVKDKETGTEHALKTVMISEFSTNEVRCLVALGDSDYFPSLYLFRLDGNKVALHMEKVEHGVTLTDIIDSHMANLCQNAPELIRPFSLCVFHGLLSAVREMHDKNWAHRDLHDGNVMITKDAMKVKILDFGMARPLKEGLNFFNHDALKNDILCVIQLFCGVYIGNDFERRDKLERQIKAGTLRQVLMETAPLSKKDGEELLQLIEKTYELTNPQLEGYGSISTIIKCIEDMLSPDEMRDEMRKAMEILFPDFYRADGDINLRERGEEEAVDKELDDFNQEATGKVIDDFLGLDISDKDV